MRKIWTAGMRAVGFVLVALMLNLAPASAQELSDRAVRAFMNYAWALTPAKFTKPDGTSVLIDKKDRSKVEIPMDVAREVIKVGRLTAHAQICHLHQDQLHLTTVMLLTGKIKLVEKTEGGKEVVIEEPDKEEAYTCTDEQRKKVKELIAAYIATEPKSEQSKAAQAPAPVKK